jgi:hypothetical protein
MSVLHFRIWNLIQFKDQLAVRMDVELLQADVIPLIKETVLDIIHTSGLGMLIYCNLFGLLWMPFRLLICFINNLQVATTVSFNTVVGLHNLQTLHTILFTLPSVVFTYLQYKTRAIPGSLNYTLPIPSAFSVITNSH